MMILALLLATPVAPLSLQDPRWHVAAEESRVEPYLGRDSIYIRNGEASLNDVTFQDGIVEFDVAAPATAGFQGLAFRAQDRGNYEHVYLRPQLSGAPDAVQYVPVFNRNSAWQIYTGARYTQPATIAPDRWVHMKAAFHDRRLELSVDGAMLVFPDLVRPLARGTIALTSFITGAHFANVTVRPGEAEPDSGGAGAAAPETPAGSVTQWRISNAFAESKLDPPGRLEPAAWHSLQWDTLGTATRGIANISAIRTLDKDHNTAFAGLTLRAKAATAVRVRFGFSDRVIVYLNGRPLYRGNDKFQTRDQRFLGTAGLYDELILPLNRGDNKLWLAVSEDFGGWAVALQLVDSVGVEVVPAE